MPQEYEEMLTAYAVATQLHMRPNEVETLDAWEMAAMRVGNAYDSAKLRKAARRG